jgi:flagellar hook-associated protein 1
MASITTLLIGRSGLRTANTGIKTTSHNVANAMTPGYNRRSVIQQAGAPIKQLGASIGTGVATSDIHRAADRLLTQRRTAAAGTSAATEKEANILEQTEHFFDETNVDRSSRKMQYFFDTLAAASADVTDQSLRRSFINAGENLATSVTNTAGELISQQESIIEEIEILLPEVNARLTEIASLNARLLDVGISGSSGDLADRRDLLVRELAQEIGATMSLDSDNVAAVLVGGHSVVFEGNERSLDMDFTPGTGISPEITMSAGKGNVYVTKDVGGQLGALLDSYDKIQTYIDELNTFATTFAAALNTQHNAGFDSAGTAGEDLFSVTATNPALNMAFNSNISNDPALLAFHGAATAFSGDDDNLQALIDLEESSMFATDSDTPGAFLTALTARVANDVGSARYRAEQESLALKDLDDFASAIGGVDLDEEAGNLIMYQTAFQASAKVIQTTDRMLGILLDLA